MGIFGFLSLGTADFSGNMGLKDQLLALQWVNENIHNFGGDKDRITIFGHSAGGASTQAHVLSPASKNLFNNAIIMSGSILSPYAIYNDEHHLEHLRKIGKILILNIFKFFKYHYFF